MNEAAAITLSDKVGFLSRPESHARPTAAVDVKETHTSFVFLTDDRVYKLKKPVHFPFLDFRSLEARAHVCREEVRLNRVLAGDIYLGTVPLMLDADGSLSLGGAGLVVDWLVEMVRLPEADLLDHRLKAGRVSRPEIDALADKMARFYAARIPARSSGTPYLAHLDDESAQNTGHLHALHDHLDGRFTDALVETAQARLDRCRGEIEDRIAAGLIVEGHGDLRPEHVCLLSPPVVIDCLEFSADMRFIDPYDEMNYLGLECTMLGADWIAPVLLGTLERALGHPPSADLMTAYGLFRALLRARLAIDHLLDAHPRTPEKWPRQARAYLDVAARLSGLQQRLD
ncbi:hypothetical protein [Polymorphum gilvum]|uniref:Aminoglycoside phosphotransferase domain-containing protein n=1 Tax=Polymorphum gilvum (strain LMG 25793 / CGMCC 1.9160 / SL003B-26A1) TaxID=991905 RepID=F2IYS8_POLGS|nr:hypothetical protein [Polymorphum gilvum]ADZ69525.1 hypothetical protein SL003B_1096 [Polymorphum gilvum SL003B-26A1]